jgi:hypothetical protein
MADLTGREAIAKDKSAVSLFFRVWGFGCGVIDAQRGDDLPRNPRGWFGGRSIW